MLNILKINKSTKVKIQDIIYLEARSNYTCIYTLEKQVVSSITLKKIMQRIGELDFLKINRGLTINKNFIISANFEPQNAFIVMKNNKILPVSRRRLVFVIENLS